MPRRRPAARTRRRLGGDRTAGTVDGSERPLKPSEVAQAVAGRPASTPSKSGDPFELDISDAERAARLEGRKLVIADLKWGISSEVMYRVDLFRRTVFRNNAVPLIQFYGPRAVRQWKVGEPKPSKWNEVEEEARLHTVDFDSKQLRLAPVKRGRRK